jgi:hypothetical protein
MRCKLSKDYTQPLGLRPGEEDWYPYILRLHTTFKTQTEKPRVQYVDCQRTIDKIHKG